MGLPEVLEVQKRAHFQPPEGLRSPGRTFLSSWRLEESLQSLGRTKNEPTGSPKTGPFPASGGPPETGGGRFRPPRDSRKASKVWWGAKTPPLPYRPSRPPPPSNQAENRLLKFLNPTPAYMNGKGKKQGKNESNLVMDRVQSEHQPKHQPSLAAKPLKMGLQCLKLAYATCVQCVALPSLSFVINLGRDDSNLAIHLSIRFQAHGDVKKVVCNSKSNGQWGAEVRPSIFPFQEGAEIKMCLCYQSGEIKVKIDGQEISFPNRLGLNSAQFFSVDGDMTLLSFKCTKC